MFKKYYFINKFDTNNIDRQDKQTVIIYRDYTSKTIDETLVIKIKKYCKKKGFKFFLSNNIRLAIKLDLDGLYIPAFNKSFKHLAFSYKKRFKIIGSAHNLREINIKEKQMVEAIFLSSLFKRNKNFLGLNKFKLLAKLTKKEVVALGGVSKNNFKKLYLTNYSSFAGISFFE